MYEQLLKTWDADVLSSRKKLKKTVRGEGGGGGVATREHDRVKISS